MISNQYLVSWWFLSRRLLVVSFVVQLRRIQKFYEDQYVLACRIMKPWVLGNGEVLFHHCEEGSKSSCSCFVCMALSQSHDSSWVFEVTSFPHSYGLIYRCQLVFLWVYVAIRFDVFFFDFMLLADLVQSCKSTLIEL